MDWKARIQGNLRPSPIPTALLLVPLARCEPLTALRIVTVVSVLCLVCSIFMLAKILAWNPVDSALFILSSGLAIIGGLRFGQPYILISMFCILGYYLHLKRRPWLAGVCLGLFAPIKYFPVIFLASFAFQKKWKVLMGGAIAIAGVGLVSIGVLGWKVHEIFRHGLGITWRAVSACRTRPFPSPPCTSRLIRSLIACSYLILCKIRDRHWQRLSFGHLA